MFEYYVYDTFVKEASPIAGFIRLRDAQNFVDTCRSVYGINPFVEYRIVEVFEREISKEVK